MTKNINILWKTISVVFHPLVVPLYFVLFYYHFTRDIILPGEMNFVLYSMAISTLIIPLLIISVLKKLKMVESMSLRTVGERRLPILAVCVLLGAAMYKMTGYASKEIMVPIMGMEIALVVLYISLWWGKISIHAMATSGVAVAVFILLYSWGYTLEVAWIPVVMSVIVYDIVVISRMEQGCHTPREIILGTAVGISSQVISFLVWG
ncbi:MAG: hypothetical protein II285_01565 [Flavobacteriales bacterium]|nr:hypothetical protein [Flavobacteriales bacterium]